MGKENTPEIDHINEFESNYWRWWCRNNAAAAASHRFIDRALALQLDYYSCGLQQQRRLIICACRQASRQAGTRWRRQKGEEEICHRSCCCCVASFRRLPAWEKHHSLSILRARRTAFSIKSAQFHRRSCNTYTAVDGFSPYYVID